MYEDCFFYKCRFDFVFSHADDSFKSKLLFCVDIFGYPYKPKGALCKEFFLFYFPTIDSKFLWCFGIILYQRKCTFYVFAPRLVMFPKRSVS